MIHGLKMKKVLIFFLLVLFCSGSVFGSEFEDNLKSAEQGNAPAQWLVGYAYYSGDGVLQGYKQAVYWYKKSAEQGYAKAQYNLGLLPWPPMGLNTGIYSKLFCPGST